MAEQNPFIIDPDRLDQEWLRMPSLSRKAGIREADAKHEHAQAKARLDVVEAELRLAIARNPENYGLEDPKVAEVTSAVITHAKYREALSVVLQAKHTVDVATAETSAMIDRRKALERLVELIALDYYSAREPTARSEEGAARIKDRVRKSSRTDIEV